MKEKLIEEQKEIKALQKPIDLEKIKINTNIILDNIKKLKEKKNDI